MPDPNTKETYDSPINTRIVNVLPDVSTTGCQANVVATNTSFFGHTLISQKLFPRAVTFSFGPKSMVF